MNIHVINRPMDLPRAIAVRALMLTVLLSLGCKQDKGVATGDSVGSRSTAGASDSARPKGEMADMPGMAMKGGAAGSEKAPSSEIAGEATAAIPQSVTLNAAQVQHGGVRWAPVVAGSSAAVATMPGELTVNEDRTARLGAPGRGRVLSVRAQPGEVVGRGQVLVVIQSAEAGMAQADVAKASAEVTSRRAGAQYAASARARAERLLTLKAIPRQDYERAIADDEQARAALAQATAELQRARSTAQQLGAAGASSSGEIVLRSPLAGVVLERTAQPGVVVEAGAPLAVVTDPSSLWLQVKAAEAQAGLFQRGGQLAFRVPAYPTERFTARIDAVGAGLDPATRTLGVRAVVPNAAGRLKPSMLATVEVQGGSRVVAILLPDGAVQLVEGKPTVFIARPDAKGGARFERRVVELGARGGGQVAITRGLSAGDVVVVAGAFAVKAQLQKGSMPDMEM
jgi:cobalt-zinc-cadmium efflux system membrane fusion protein